MNTQKSAFWKSSKLLLGLILCLTVVVSCSSDDDNPPPVNEEELITNVTLTFINTANDGDRVVMTSVAPDGQDGASTEVVEGNFTAGATYSLSLAITNNQETPPDDVLNDDIIPEADEHFFSYAVNGLDMTISRDADDVDGPDGTKLGVFTTWTAGSASTGGLRIILTHLPEGPDDSDDFGSVTGGETDIDIIFDDIEIQ